LQIWFGFASAGKKDSGMPDVENKTVNYVVMIGTALVIVLVAVAAVTLAARMTLI
jgi:hypothetical protein